MALTDLQRSILAALSGNRSKTSYIAGGVALNRDWPRMSDDIDVFHGADEKIVDAARRDIETLRRAGFTARVDVETYGVVEATVAQKGSETVIPWMSESRRRFLPLVEDEAYGFRLAQADLAVNKARNYVDLVSIARNWCALGPLALAASGKPPFYSPSRIIEEIRRRRLGVWDDEYRAVKAVPESWSPAFMREALADVLDQAQAYVERAPLEALGRVVSDVATMTPAEISPENVGRLEFRRATDEQDPVPQFKEVLPG